MSVIEVAIGPEQAPGMFRVEVVSSPGGEAAAVAALDASGLLARRAEVQHAVLASSVPTRRVLEATEQCVRDVGQAVFSALPGTGEVSGRYRASAALAAERGERLRLALRVNDPLLAGLPWERCATRLPEDTCAAGTSWSRRVAVPSSPLPLAVDPPLRAAKRALASHTSVVQDVAFSPDGSLLASGGKDRTMRVWD